MIDSRTVRANINYWMGKNNITNEDIAKGLGITEGGWSYKQKNLQNLKIKDLNRICQILKCPSPQALITPLR